MERPEFPVAIDSSMRAAFVECPTKFHYQYLRNLRPRGESVHLIAGGAFARGCEVTRRAFYDEGKSLNEALELGIAAAVSHYGSFEPPPDSAKTCGRVVEALEEFFHQYPPFTDHCQPAKREDGKHAIEFKFSVPLGVTHPTTKEPILYVGRSDMIVEYNGMRMIEDDKTTSQLGQSWPGSWALRGQIDGYIWADQQHGNDTRGAVIRGISFLKTKFGHAESLQLRTKWQIDRWYKQLCRDIERMKGLWEEGVYDLALDTACTSYGGCPFVALCKVENPEPWIEQDYEVRVWSPLDIVSGN